MSLVADLSARTLPDWQIYYVDFKNLCDLVQKLKGSSASSEAASDEFFSLLEKDIHTVNKFFHRKLQWCRKRLKDINDRIEHFCATGKWISESDTDTDKKESRASKSADGSLGGEEEGERSGAAAASEGEVPKVTIELYHYAKKMLTDFVRELDLVEEYADVNKAAFGHVVSHFDSELHLSTHDGYIAQLKQRDGIRELWGDSVSSMRVLVANLNTVLAGVEVRMVRTNRKVYTIGCFDLFHRGHENMLKALYEFGNCVIVGIHDDESYFKLKKKDTIEKLPERIQNVKKFVDMVFVIPDTDPTAWIAAMISDNDVKNGACCYVRGEDMPDFPGREYIEARMPVFLLPRSEDVSSTLLRTIYHCDDKSHALAAAFADTDEVGRPIMD